MRPDEREVAGLTCGQVMAVLSDVVDGAIAPALGARVEAHVAGCARCQTECADRDRVGECVDACARRRGGCTATERRICQWHGVSFGLTEQ